MKLSQWERRKKAYLSRPASWVNDDSQIRADESRHHEKIQFFLNGKSESALIELGFVVIRHGAYGEYLALTGQKNWEQYLVKYLAYKKREALWRGHWHARVHIVLPSVRNSVNDIALFLAHMLTLGWREDAIHYGNECLPRLERGFYRICNEYDEPGSRAGKFIMRLFADWQNITPVLPLDLADTEVYQNVLKVWRDVELDRVTPALLAALDEHLEQTRHTSSDSVWPCEFDSFPYFAYPVEILMVLRLRQYLNLPLPVLDHPLMVPPLGILPEPTEPYTDDLLKAFEAKLRKDYPQMSIAPDPPPQQPPKPKPLDRPLLFVNLVQRLKSWLKR